MCYQNLTTGRRGLAPLLWAWQLGCLDPAGVGECGLLDQSPGSAPLLWVPGLTCAPCSPILVSSLGLQPI